MCVQLAPSTRLTYSRALESFRGWALAHAPGLDDFIECIERYLLSLSAPPRTSLFWRLSRSSPTCTHLSPAFWPLIVPPCAPSLPSPPGQRALGLTSPGLPFLSTAPLPKTPHCMPSSSSFLRACSACPNLRDVLQETSALTVLPSPTPNAEPTPSGYRPLCSSTSGFSFCDETRCVSDHTSSRSARPTRSPPRDTASHGTLFVVEAQPLSSTLSNNFRQSM